MPDLVHTPTTHTRAPARCRLCGGRLQHTNHATRCATCFAKDGHYRRQAINSAQTRSTRLRPDIPPVQAGGVT